MNWVLLHGFVGSSEDFAPLQACLGNPSRVIAPDWPGHGARSGLRHPADYTLEAHLRLVDRAVAANPGPVTLVGYSLGGRLLQHWLASRRPTLPRGSRIALVSTSPGLAEPDERASRLAGDAAVSRLLREDGIGRFLHYWHSQTMFHPLLQLPADRLNPILARRRTCDPEGLALSLAAVGAGAIAGTWDTLGRWDVPTLLIAGALDRRYVELAEQMRERLTGAGLRIVTEGGHALHLERPEVLAGHLLEPL